MIAYWTDICNDVTFWGITRKGQDAYFTKTS